MFDKNAKICKPDYGEKKKKTLHLPSPSLKCSSCNLSSCWPLLIRTQSWKLWSMHFFVVVVFQKFVQNDHFFKKIFPKMLFFVNFTKNGHKKFLEVLIMRPSFLSNLTPKFIQNSHFGYFSKKHNLFTFRTYTI